MVFQVNTSILDACVLSALRYDDAYGYVLTQRIRETFELSESTLYPVLRRLQKTGFLRVYDENFGGRNRRYYSITEQGREQDKLNQAAWKEFKSRVDKFIEEKKPAKSAKGGDTNDK